MPFSLGMYAVSGNILHPFTQYGGRGPKSLLTPVNYRLGSVSRIRRANIPPPLVLHQI